MEVHFQCTIQICRYQCPEQCTQHQGPPIETIHLDSGFGQSYTVGKPREERDVSSQLKQVANTVYKIDSTQVGVNRIIQVVSAGDLSFALQPNETLPVFSEQRLESDVICMSMIGFTASLVILIVILLVSCLFSVFLCLRQRSLDSSKKLVNSSISLSYDMRTFSKKPPHVQINKR
jgi:hypothetical protein